MDLFYSGKEKILFLVVGYADNTDNVEQIIKKLTEGANKLVELSFEEKENINTFVVTCSRHYKGKRVFWVRTDNVPEGAFEITGDWTMTSWLSSYSPKNL